MGEVVELARARWAAACAGTRDVISGGAALAPGRRGAVLLQAAEDVYEIFKPGGRLHPTYFLEHEGHLVVEAVFLAVIAYLTLHPRAPHRSRKQEMPLSEQEIDDLCEEWQPEPLHKPLPNSQALPEPPVISSAAGAWVVANGRRVLNMVSLNFLGVAGDPVVMEECAATVVKYGVGSCGPRGFYGTIDVHLELEARLAEFMGTEESIIYAYDLATIPSVLPAFANAKDLIVCDEGVSYPIQNGCHLSRAKVRYFKHNDVADLERVLLEVAAQDRRVRKPLNRRFIVVEGIYAQYGDLAPLAAIHALKCKYRYRLVVDESLALGVLGAHGRGACEHSGLAPGQVEIVAASMGNALASVGGFCAGEREIVDHQRLSGLGYCYSASLPPLLATAALGTLRTLQGAQAPKLLAALQRNARLLRDLLANIPGVSVWGGDADEASPIVHLQLAAAEGDAQAAEAVLQAAVDAALADSGVLLVVNRLSPLDRVRVKPSIRLAVTAAHSEADVRTAAAAVADALARVVPATPCPVSKQPS
ncbi:hypothetical protein WJX81_007034 [Elliptochloris bilobata]|uniref:serine C-palmitoyltransferase n=1 Tax=Elliptochloris bilobata TaxID=381761 RepID=A0AAW1S420_9CHLO